MSSTKEDLTELIRKYIHYKTMINNNPFRLNPKTSLYDFLQWLESQEDNQ